MNKYSKRYIIVKYSKDYFPNGQAPMECSVHTTYSAILCDVSAPYYNSVEEAQKDLKALREFNPRTFYNIVEDI